MWQNFENLNCDKTNKLNCGKTQKLELKQNSETLSSTKLKKSATQIVTSQQQKNLSVKNKKNMRQNFNKIILKKKNPWKHKWWKNNK